ncbi:MAG: hypothetical protein ACJ0RA_03540 [Candidatus Neomarinimicrobiota bacterium]
MKKLLLLLLFSGLSFGQVNQVNTSNIEGVWKVNGLEQSFVFKQDNSGYYFVNNDDGTSISSPFDWSLINSKKK